MLRTLLGFLLGFLLLFCHSLPTLAQASETIPQTASGTARIPLLSINGAIGPAVGDYLIRAIEEANNNTQIPLLVITIDTPGGLVSSLRDINQTILAAKVPIACLVHPQGARAASAGTYILYACHIAAMAPATTLGAATPVQIGGSGSSPGQEEKSSPSAMEKKILNDSIAYIRSLAQLRGRNAQWAELAVSEAATLTADEALAQNVIGYIADSPQQLLDQLDGQQIMVAEQLQTLVLDGVELQSQQPDWRNRFISTITDPNIAYILMLLGFYGLLLEFYSPGIGVAGVIGAISLIIALYAFQALPVNYAGMLLIFLGIGLLVTESMLPSFGIFGFGGLVAFVIGSIFLIDSDLQQFRIALPLIAAITLVTAAFILLLLGYLWRARGCRVVSGREAIIGAQVTVMADFENQPRGKSGSKGRVLLGGECWAAESTQPGESFRQGKAAVVSAINGLVLTVNQAP